MRSKKDGQKIAGSEGRITPSQIASALGLRKDAPPEPTQKLSPAQARAKAEGKPIPELPEDAAPEVHTIPGGSREALELWGGAGHPDMPVGVEEGMAPPEPKPKSEGWEGDAPERQPMTTSPEASAARAEAERLRAEARESVRGTIKRGVAALESNDPARIQRAESEARDALTFGEKVKRALKVERF